MFIRFRSMLCRLFTGSILALPIILALACTAESLDRTILDLELADPTDQSGGGMSGDDSAEPADDATDDPELINSDEPSDGDDSGESSDDPAGDAPDDSDVVDPAEAPDDEGSESLDPAGLPDGDESDEGADEEADNSGGGSGAGGGGGGGGGAPPADDGGGPDDGSSNGLDGSSNGLDDGSSNGLDEPPDDVDGDDDEPIDDTTTSGNEYCEQVEIWDANWAQFEQEVIDLVNERRSQGAVCGDDTFGPAGPLTLNTALRCAARNHAEDMAVRDFFAHTNPDGDGPGQRIGFAEYDSQGWGENIAMGFPSPQSVIVGWMTSPGHCANIMKPSFTEIGVGFYSGNRWVQVFGTPR